MTRTTTLSAAEKLSHYKTLIGIAASDGTIQEEERSVLEFCASKWEIEPAQAKAVLDAPGDIKITLPEDPALRFELLYDVVEIMIIDGVMAKAEKAICKDFAEGVGFTSDTISTIIQGILEGNRLHHGDEEKQRDIKAKLGLA